MNNRFLQASSAQSNAIVSLGFVLTWGLCLLAFWPALNGPFVFDDFPNLQNLREISGTLDWSHLGRYLASFTGNPGRPLSALSFLIEDWAWPSEPTAFKRNNLLLHLLTGVVLFCLARRLARLEPRWAAHADWVALATMAMWLLHPMQLSATMLVVQRMNILSTLCMGVGLLGYLRMLQPGTQVPVGGPRALTALALLAIATVVAVLFKENGALLPVYALALNLTLLRPMIASMPKTTRRLLWAGTAVPLALLIAGVWLFQDSVLQGYAIRDFTMGERLLTQPRILFAYLDNILLPSIGGLGIFHDGYAASRSFWSPPSTAAALLAFAAVIAGAWRLRHRFPAFTFSVAWFIGGHLMESTIIPLELYFEHRNYLPMFGPLLAVTGTLLGITGRYQLVARSVLVSWLAMSAALTAYNATIWGDRAKLSLVWLEEQPKSTRAAQMAAGYYFDQGEYDAARRVLAAAKARIPTAIDLHFQQALVDCIDGGVSSNDWSRLEEHANNAPHMRVIPEVVASLIKQSLAGGCHGTVSPSAAEQLGLAIVRNPAIAQQEETVGFLYYELAKIPENERDLNRLMFYLDASYKHRPNPFVPREQAIHLLTAGLPEDALRYLDMSDNTPLPWIKAKLLNVEAMNAPLRRSALEMQAAQRGTTPQPDEIRR